jgi:hypothetical protein
MRHHLDIGPRISEKIYFSRKIFLMKSVLPAVNGVVRWRLKDLAQWIFEEFGTSLDETTIWREPKRPFPASSTNFQHMCINFMHINLYRNYAYLLGKIPLTRSD